VPKARILLELKAIDEGTASKWHDALAGLLKEVAEKFATDAAEIIATKTPVNDAPSEPNYFGEALHKSRSPIDDFLAGSSKVSE
jgi:hypothetical protein